MTVYQGTSFTPERTATGYALFRAGVKVSAGTCEDLAGSLRRRHERNGTRWRLLSPLAQAVLVIAFLRTNLTYAELAAGFGVSASTCWRDVAEGISVLADRGRRISLKDAARLAVKMGWDYLIVDGVHVPAVTSGRKTGGQRAFYSGKHKRHGLNVQTVCSPAGELLRAAAPAPGATVDVTAARKAGIAGDILRFLGLFADLGYLGLDKEVVTGRRKPRGKDLTARAAGREPAAGPAPLRRRTRQRPPEVLESPGQRAALPPGGLHRHGQGGPGPALHGTRPVRRRPRRVTGPDRYRAATLLPPSRPYPRPAPPAPKTSRKNHAKPVKPPHALRKPRMKEAHWVERHIH